MIDKRVSLWDIRKQEFQVGEVTYLLEKPPKKGATCIVYDVRKEEWVDGEVYPQRVLLKEFYPMLSADSIHGIQREDSGKLVVTESVRESEEYQQALKRFKNAYSVMRELANVDEGAEFLSVPTSLVLANGTWYMEEPYDSGVTLADLFAEDAGGYFDIDRFLDVFFKCLITVARLHARGYLHLDLTPWNISYTKSGNIKLFDTDSFLKKSELKNGPMLLQTKGYSAPELFYAGKDAAYLVGEWTDIYSLAQLICWYIYGRPLEQWEIAEKLQQMESTIDQRFELPPNTSRKGLFRLKAFLAENLSRDIKQRKQTIINEEFLYTDWRKYHADENGELKTWEDTYVYDEMVLIQRFLFEDYGEPIDNFVESKEAVYGYEEELEQLESYFYESSSYSRVICLVGEDKEQREKLARFFATVHRLDHSNIVEIHCSDFEGLCEKFSKRFGFENAFLNPYPNYPQLFLVFDEATEDVFYKEEAKDLYHLLEYTDMQVLIVGAYNRYMDWVLDRHSDWVPEDDENIIFVPTVDMDTKESDELVEVVNFLKENPQIRKWSWKQWAVQALAAVMLFVGFWVLKPFLEEAVEQYMYYDHAVNQYVCESWFAVTGLMLANILANGMGAVGIGLAYFCAYDLLTPRGLHWFTRQYTKYIMAGWMGLTSLNLPYMFRAFSFSRWCDIFGIGNWRIIETCMEVLQVPVLVLLVGMIVIWMAQILEEAYRNTTSLNIITNILMCLSLVHIVIQTIANPWELLILGVCIWGSEWYIYNKI